MATEAKRVAQGGPYFSVLWFPEREIQPRVQYRVVGEMVDRRWHLVMDDAHHSGDRLDDAGGPKAVPRHGFGGADIGGERMFAEDVRDRLHLCRIAPRGRRAMRVYIVDVSRPHSGLAQGSHHYVLCPQAFGMGGRHV